LNFSSLRGRHLVFLLGTMALLGCGGDSTGDDLPDLVLVKVSGDSQQVAIGANSDLIVVSVLDDEGAPVEGVAVVFEVGPGNGLGTVDPLLDTTDAAGNASTRFLGSTIAGARKVHAGLTVPGTEELTFDLNVGAGTVAHLVTSGWQETAGDAGTLLPVQLRAKATDAWGNPVADVPVVWSIVSGGGSLSDDTVLTGVDGNAYVGRTLGPAGGGQFVKATTPSLPDSAIFHQTARKAMTVLGGGNNVPERYTSDLWVHGDYAYTGTWGMRSAQGNTLKVWNIAGGTPVLADSVKLITVGTVSDNEVSADGSLLLLTTEGGGGSNGIYIYSLADPAHPALLDSQVGFTGIHTGTFATIGGQLYVFAAKNPSAPALLVFRIQVDSVDKIVQVGSVAQPANYGIHDQFIRDGYAFASVWNTGIRIYDVGNGSHGGTPAVPVLVSTLVTQTDIGCACVHNAWWYQDPQGGKKYLFVGQEGPGAVGSSSSGDIHLVDITNMNAPEEIGSYHMADVGGQSAGVHNFWADESRGILYAAYYNGGVLALDISGHPFGNLETRQISVLRPAGAGTYVWGVMLANGALWASDMLSGLWKLSPP
jgi:hypothetical protein